MEMIACINQILDRDFFFSFSLAKKKKKKSTTVLILNSVQNSSDIYLSFFLLL